MMSCLVRMGNRWVAKWTNEPSEPVTYHKPCIVFASIVVTKDHKPTNHSQSLESHHRLPWEHSFNGRKYAQQGILGPI